MKNSVKKLTSLALAALMALSCLTTLTACGDNNENADDTLPAGETAGEGETKSPYEALEKTPLGGEFVVLSRADVKSDFYVEAYGLEGNTLLDDYIYERNKVIERDLDITLNIIEGGDYAAVNTTVMNQATGGLDEYDVFTGHKYTFTGCAQNNYLYDMNDIDSLELSNPWWDKTCRENLTVNGHTVLMVGDILPSSMKISSCLAFNKRILSDLNREAPYDAVKEGKWTLDMLNEMTAGVTSDLNGDGKIKAQDDQFGMTSWYLNSPYDLYYGTGRVFITINDDGLPELNYNADEMLAIYDKIYSILITQESNFITEIAEIDNDYNSFVEGRALVRTASLGSLTSYSGEMEDDYGVLPQPKYEEKQEDYCSFVNGASAFMGIISTEQNPEFVGAVLEAMGAYNYTTVSPNMFEIVTKYRSTRDPQSAEMVDYIIRNRIFDFGYFFDLAITNVVRDSLKAKKDSLGSSIKSADKSSENTLKKILKAYEKYQ